MHARAGHIPPGIETFGYTALWYSNYLKTYRAIVTDHVKTIAAQLFAHVHADEFRLLPGGGGGGGGGGGPIITTGAISPVYNNNPSFKLVEPVFFRRRNSSKPIIFRRVLLIPR